MGLVTSHRLKGTPLPIYDRNFSNLHLNGNQTLVAKHYQEMSTQSGDVYLQQIYWFNVKHFGKDVIAKLAGLAINI